MAPKSQLQHLQLGISSLKAKDQTIRIRCLEAKKSLKIAHIARKKPRNQKQCKFREICTLKKLLRREKTTLEILMPQLMWNQSTWELHYKHRLMTRCLNKNMNWNHLQDRVMMFHPSTLSRAMKLSPYTKTSIATSQRTMMNLTLIVLKSRRINL